MRFHSLVVVLVVLLLTGAALTSMAAVPQLKAKGPVYETPEAAEKDADFAFQGEYRTDPKASTQVGIQVIARGKHVFHAVKYTGGLPGAGWKLGDPKEEANGTLNGDNVCKFQFGTEDWELIKFTPTPGKIFTAKQETYEVLHKRGNTVLNTAAKVVRANPTLGEKRPKDAIVLFDGSNTDAFVGKVEMTDDKLLIPEAVTKQNFQNFHLHAEFRTPYMPEDLGQNRGNSGIYLQNRYEIQIVDSFGLAGEHNECGGFYKFLRPDVNMCLPPLVWQTYDIDFIAAKFKDGKKIENARVTAKHNGVLIHDNRELKSATLGAGLKETDSPGPFLFQQHGNAVRFRNVWVVEKK